MIPILIRAGANIDDTGRHGQTLLHKVSIYIQTTAFEVDDQSACITQAALFGHADVAEELLKLKADKSIVDYFGDTPLDIARANGNQAVVNVLTQIKRVQKAVNKAIAANRLCVWK